MAYPKGFVKSVPRMLAGRLRLMGVSQTALAGLFFYLYLLVMFQAYYFIPSVALLWSETRVWRTSTTMR